MLQLFTSKAFDNNKILRTFFASCIFIGSFLLFQVQLVLGKYILPWFGGSPGVWNTCILFFQAMLLIGYVYAHVLTTLKLQKQVYTHIVLLAFSLLLLPIIPSSTWKPTPDEIPALKVLLLLCATVGVPYLLLSASAPLLQHWHVQRFPHQSPWRLYALSNFASLLGLISYPFIVEPFVGLTNQCVGWGWCYVIYAVLCTLCAAPLLLQHAGFDGPMAVNAEEPHREKSSYVNSTVSLWIMIAACSSAVLLAATNELCQDIASIPLLWMLPLAVYLTTFIICFSKASNYHRVTWCGILFISILGSEYFKLAGFSIGLMWQIIINVLLLLASCMVCHGELVRLRPAHHKLTSFYLSIAGGGVLGSAFVSLMAPLLFTSVVELPVVLTAMLGVLVIVYWQSVSNFRGIIGQLLMVLGLISQLAYTANFVYERSSEGVVKSRSFFGVLRVDENETNAGPVRNLHHGTTVHGYQFLLAENRSFPTSYYTADSGVGVALRLFQGSGTNGQFLRNRRVGIIGLGVGTVASYGSAGDVFRFYEINDDVINIAQQHFSFIADSAARVEIVHGDARLAMENELSGEKRQQFDILIVDAFTSDAVPIHLLTREAVILYLKQLKPDGVLLFNISNRYLNLWPVIKGHGRALGMEAALLVSNTNVLGKEEAAWCVLTNNNLFLTQEEVANIMKRRNVSPVDWTDDFASIFQVL